MKELGQVHKFPLQHVFGWKLVEVLIKCEAICVGGVAGWIEEFDWSEYSKLTSE